MPFPPTDSARVFSMLGREKADMRWLKRPGEASWSVTETRELFAALRDPPERGGMWASDTYFTTACSPSRYVMAAPRSSRSRPRSIAGDGNPGDRDGTGTADAHPPGAAPPREPLVPVDAVEERTVALWAQDVLRASAGARERIVDLGTASGTQLLQRRALASAETAPGATVAECRRWLRNVLRDQERDLADGVRIWCRALGISDSSRTRDRRGRDSRSPTPPPSHDASGDGDDARRRRRRGRRRTAGAGAGAGDGRRESAAGAGAGAGDRRRESYRGAAGRGGRRGAGAGGGGRGEHSSSSRSSRSTTTSDDDSSRGSVSSSMSTRSRERAARDRRRARAAASASAGAAAAAEGDLVDGLLGFGGGGADVAADLGLKVLTDARKTKGNVDGADGRDKDKDTSRHRRRESTSGSVSSAGSRRKGPSSRRRRHESTSSGSASTSAGARRTGTSPRRHGGATAATTRSGDPPIGPTACSCGWRQSQAALAARVPSRKAGLAAAASAGASASRTTRQSRRTDSPTTETMLRRF